MMAAIFDPLFYTVASYPGHNSAGECPDKRLPILLELVSKGTESGCLLLLLLLLGLLLLWLGRAIDSERASGVASHGREMNSGRGRVFD
jgi:hypothetical protein